VDYLINQVNASTPLVELNKKKKQRCCLPSTPKVVGQKNKGELGKGIG